MKIRTSLYAIALVLSVNVAVGQDVINPLPTGTSGHKVPYLDGPNTWSAANAFGILTGTSLALGGCAIGSNALCVTGPTTLTESAGSSALTITGATQTANNPVLNLTQTWNNSGVTFTGLRLNVTNTASGNSSLLFDLQAGGSSKFNVNAFGDIVAPSSFNVANSVYLDFNGKVAVKSSGTIGFSSTTNATAALDTLLTRSGAASLQLGAADAAAPVAQTLRVQSVVAGTAAANGANWTLIGSLPTGTGTSGDIIIQTGVKTGSGTTQGTATTALTIKGETQAVTSTGVLSTSNTTDSTTTTTGALQSAGGLAVLKRVFFGGLTASAGLQTAVLCLSAGNEVIADSVACLASSEAFKENIAPSDMGLDTVMALKPIVYKYKATGNERFDNAPNQRAIHAGFSAEQAATVDARLIAYDAEGKIRTVRPDAIPAALVLAVQQLKTENDLLRERLERLEVR